MNRTVALIAVLAALAVLPASAEAGRARVASGRVVYDAFPGEINDAGAVRVDATTVTVTDNGATVVAGSDCKLLDAHNATCINAKKEQGIALNLGDGNDHATSAVAFLDGGDGDDTLTQTFHEAGDADAAPYVYPPFDNQGLALGGPGNDTIVATFASGGAGNDTLSAPPGLQGVLFGGPGDDAITGSTAADTFAPGPGKDKITTGGGADRLVLSDDTGPFTVDLGAGTILGASDTYVGTFASVTGASATDQLTGDDTANELSLGKGDGDGGKLAGKGGDDLLDGGLGKDTIAGGDGDDVLSDGDQNGNVSTLDGGAGNDTLKAADYADEDGVTEENEINPTADNLTCGDGIDLAIVDSADVVPADCEIVARRTPAKSTITGTAGNDVLDGFSGDGDADVIKGLAGNDVISGYDGNDRLDGGKGKDRIKGGNGKDKILARDGHRDKISCGPGKDRVTADKNDSVAKDCEVVGRG